jgi:hypothetical protein
MIDPLKQNACEYDAEADRLETDDRAEQAPAPQR